MSPINNIRGLNFYLKIRKNVNIILLKLKEGKCLF